MSMKYELKILVGAFLLMLTGAALLYLGRKAALLLEIVGFIAVFLGGGNDVKTLFIVLREG